MSDSAISTLETDYPHTDNAPTVNPGGEASPVSKQITNQYQFTRDREIDIKFEVESFKSDPADLEHDIAPTDNAPTVTPGGDASPPDSAQTTDQDRFSVQHQTDIKSQVESFKRGIWLQPDGYSDSKHTGYWAEIRGKWCQAQVSRKSDGVMFPAEEGFEEQSILLFLTQPERPDQMSTEGRPKHVVLEYATIEEIAEKEMGRGGRTLERLLFEMDNPELTQPRTPVYPASRDDAKYMNVIDLTRKGKGDLFGGKVTFFDDDLVTRIGLSRNEDFTVRLTALVREKRSIDQSSAGGHARLEEVAPVKDEVSTIPESSSADYTVQ